MENYINESPRVQSYEGVDDMGKKVLIATLYNSDPVILAATRLGT